MYRILRIIGVENVDGILRSLWGQNIGEIKVPIVVRLQGTNSEEGAKIIKESGLEVFSANTLQNAADKINEILKN